MLYYTYTSSLSPSHFLGSPLSLTSHFFIQVQLVFNGHHRSCGRRHCGTCNSSWCCVMSGCTRRESAERTLKVIKELYVQEE